MRITMINKHYPPHLGGIEFHMRDLAEALVERGQDVTVLVANESKQRVEETIRGVDVIRLPKQFGISSAPVALSMRREIKRLAEKTDVFHLHFPYPWGEFSWLLANAGVPTVITYHSDIVRQKLGLTLIRPVLERVMDKVDVIVAGSPNMVVHSELLIPRADKCEVIPFGIHVEKYQQTPESAAKASEFRAAHEGRKIVLFVGRLIYYKGVDVLVRAMENVDADLVIIGKGQLENEIRDMATANGSIGRITFVPRASHEDLIAWYQAADVFCLPSVARSEAYGLVQLEAQASGTPVVATNLPSGVPFVNQDGYTGFNVTPGNPDELAVALNKLLADDALRTRFGSQAQERAVRDFSTQRMTDQWIALYDRLVGLH